MRNVKGPRNSSEAKFKSNGKYEETIVSSLLHGHFTCFFPRLYTQSKKQVAPQKTQDRQFIFQALHRMREKQVEPQDIHDRQFIKKISICDIRVADKADTGCSQQ